MHPFDRLARRFSLAGPDEDAIKALLQQQKNALPADSAAVQTTLLQEEWQGKNPPASDPFKAASDWFTSVFSSGQKAIPAATTAATSAVDTVTTSTETVAAEPTKESLFQAFKRAPLPIILLGVAGAGLIAASFIGGKKR